MNRIKYDDKGGKTEDFRYFYLFIFIPIVEGLFSRKL